MGLARHQWLTPVIPDTEEADIRSIMAGSQPLVSPGVTSLIII
jgi:hypothetical protein